MKKKKSPSKLAPPTLPEKVRTPEEIRDWIRSLHATVEPDQTLIEVDKALKKNVGSNLTKETEKKVESAFLMLGHERHYLVAESVTDERWRPMILDLAACIQKEYGCASSSEIALAGLAASAYYRSLTVARRMSGLLARDTGNEIIVQLIAHTSKEVDRAYRQYLAAIETLRSRRQPQLNVKIQTNAAFFNEHQTINAAHAPHAPHATNNDPQ